MSASRQTDERGFALNPDALSDLYAAGKGLFACVAAYVLLMGTTTDSVVAAMEAWKAAETKARGEVQA